jgi:hypothetical protein
MRPFAIIAGWEWFCGNFKKPNVFNPQGVKIKSEINLVRCDFYVFLHSQKRYNGPENETVIKVAREVRTRSSVGRAQHF